MEYFTFTQESKKIQELLLTPVRSREAAGYHRDFLDRYSPNETFYLDADIRKSLYQMGDLKYSLHDYAKPLAGDLSWNSSRLEGNTYSLSETRQLLSGSPPPEDKSPEETQMILNHKDAIEFLMTVVKDVGLNSSTVCNLHALLSDNLLGDKEACGRLRSIPIKISGTAYLPTGIPSLIEECFHKIIDTASQIQDPFEQAFFLMVHLPYLQSFEDVNKRTSRLAANIPLLTNNLCPFTFVDVDVRDYFQGLIAIYEFNKTELLRDVFFWGYHRSCVLYGRGLNVKKPNPLFVKHRSLMKSVVRDIVQQKMDKKRTVAFLEEKKYVLPSDEQAEFVTMIEEELAGLHSGNIARFKLTPQEYQAWDSSRP